MNRRSKRMMRGKAFLKRTVLGMMILSLLTGTGVLSVPVFGEEKTENVKDNVDVIARNSYGDTSWVLDANGKLTIEGTGEVDKVWRAYLSEIKTVEIRVTGMTDASYLFSECENLVSVDASGFDTSSVTNMYGMFSECGSLTTVDVSGFDTHNVTDMGWMFYGCSSLTNLDVSGFDTSNAEYTDGMFSECSSLTALDVSGFDTGKVTDINSMFLNCSNLTALDVSGFDTGKVEYMNMLFKGCSGLTAIDVSGFDTGSLLNMEEMFVGCSGLKSLDLSSFDMGKFESTFSGSLLEGCSSLTTIKSPRNNIYDISLPSSEGTWYVSDGTAVATLPKNLSYSVEIGKNYIPAGTNPESDSKTKLTTKNTTIKLSKESYTYNGKAKEPTVKVYNSKGKVIKAEYYTVTYRNNTKVGKATVTIKFKGKYTGTIKAAYTIKPRATAFSDTSGKTNRVTLSWKKQTRQVSGYQIQYATDSKFTKNKTTVLVKGAKKSSKTITGLSGKTTYYFRIRTYKTMNGKKYYSAWSKAQTVKTK